MKRITYPNKNPITEKPDQKLLVREHTSNGDLLVVEIVGSRGEGTGYVALNPLQVDKLRQQFHGWLHERANTEDGVNWTESSR